MQLALILDGVVQREATTMEQEMVGPNGRPLLDVRDVSGVAGIMPGWTVDAAGTYAPPAVAPVVPDRCSKLGLKRALAETGPDAAFAQPEWPAVKAAIEADAELQEDWDLATTIVRSDPLVQRVIAARKYDSATVDKILVRAKQLAA